MNDGDGLAPAVAAALYAQVDGGRPRSLARGVGRFTFFEFLLRFVNVLEHVAALARGGVDRRAAGAQQRLRLGQPAAAAGGGRRRHVLPALRRKQMRSRERLRLQ